MADFDGVIDPAAEWAEVPQLSTQAQALAGPGGPMNAQAVALAKRTKHLKEGLENASQQIGNLGNEVAGKQAASPVLSMLSGPNGFLGFRNKIINGDMRVAQRGVSFFPLANNGFVADRWQFGNNAGAVFNASTSAADGIAAAGFPHALTFSVATAQASLPSNSVIVLDQQIEGYNARPLINSTFTVSFWVKASVKGTYCVTVSNAAATMSYIAEYQIDTANVWEKKTIVIPAPAGGDWDVTNGCGLRLRFVMASGSGRMAAPNVWTSVQGVCATSAQTNLAATAGNSLQITGVQVEPGAYATPFEHRPFSLELSLCQRYCVSFEWVGNSSSTVGIGGYCTGSAALTEFTPPVQMRATPTFVGAELRLAGAVTSTAVTSITLRSSKIMCTANQSNTAGQSVYAVSEGVGTGFRGFVAEL